MNTLPSLYGYVMAWLRSRAIPQREVARGSEVPLLTVTKIAQDVIANPSVPTIQKLYDYFRGRGLAGGKDERSCAGHYTPGSSEDAA